MIADIKEMVSECSTCADYQIKQQKEILKTYKIPARPCSRGSFHTRKDCLIIVDYYSDFGN